VEVYYDDDSLEINGVDRGLARDSLAPVAAGEAISRHGFPPTADPEAIPDLLGRIEG
jgi:hypothetical protein